MRITLLFAAAALAVAGPAIAQNTAAADNGDTAAPVVDANTAVVDNTALAGNVTVEDPVVIDSNDMVVEDDPGPVTGKRPKSFPWGVLGLLGLVGLLGRKR
jgi:hypothetical protein